MDSIYNVYKHVEFHGGLTDQYGHYALFFWVPLKIFGFSTKTIAGVCGVLSGLTYIFAMSSFCRIVKSNILRYLVIVVGGMYAISPMIGSIYWQLYPHRVIFPAITLFLTTVFKESRINAWKKCGAMLVMTMAVIWNFETGIICCLAWAAFRGNNVLQNEELSVRSMGRALGRAVGIVILPVAVAYGVVNIYNLFCGGMTALLGIKEFIGMVVDDACISSLCTPLEWGNMTYLHKVMIFLIYLCWGVLHNHLFGKEGMKEKAGYAVVTGIIGLGLTTYYVNRTLAGDHLVNLFFVICLGLILDGMSQIDKNRKHFREVHVYNVIKYMAGVYALVVLLGCGLESMGLYQGYVNKYNANAYSYEDFSAFAKEVAEVVPENTWAMGDGMSALYMELGWEKGTWGFGDVQADEIPKQDTVFVSNIRYDVVPENFTLVHEFIYYDIAFGYFVKEEE